MESRPTGEPTSLEALDRALFGTGTPRGAPSRRPSHAPSTPSAERRAILGVAVAAALAGALASGQPAGWGVADALIRGAAAAVLALGASRARRWTWIWCAGLATVASDSPLALAAAGTALCLSGWAVLADRRTRWLGAVVGGLTAQALLRLPDTGFFGSSLLVSALAAAPVIVSAYRVAPRRVRRRVHQALVAAAVCATLGGVLLGVSAVLARDRVEAAIGRAQAGLAAARSGKPEVAAEHLEAASEGFRSANGIVGAWWVAPARLVPVVGQHARALDVATEQGARITESALGAARSVDTDRFTWDDGRLDLDLIAAAQDPLATTATSLEGARDALDAVTTPWLAPPIRARVDELRAEAAEALPDAVLAADLAQVGPEILGANGTRRYFVAFTTPAESRGSGGFMGSWAEITADDGDLTLTRSGRTAELNQAPGERELVAGEARGDDRLADYVRRYSVYEPWSSMQDVTLSPDFPTVAQALDQLYPQAGGQELDGVLMVDPYALAALMSFTGPIRVDGLDEPLTSRNAAEFLLVDQYARFGEQTEREDFLTDVAEATFEELTTGDLPNPRRFADVLNPLVREGRLLLFSDRGEEQGLFERLGLDGALPPVDGGDFLSVVTQNAANNKIDAYLERDIDYRVDIDPETGALQAHATVQLTNGVPSLDLPEAVVGSNDRGLPPGTNDVFFNLYTPWDLVTATVDGSEVELEADSELDRHVYSTLVRVPMGETRTVVVELEGSLGPFDRYRLRYAPQPLVNPDRLSIRVEGPGWESGHNLEVVGDRRSASAGGSAEVDRLYWVDAGGPP